MELDKKQISLQIQKEIKETKALILTLRELTKPIAPDCAIGRISRMDAINNKTINEASLRKSEVKLKGLIAALDRVDEPEFGICAKCRQSIPLGRIMLVPHSRFCARCVD